MSLLIEQIKCNNERKDAIVRIMAYIPCIMHMETRIGIKILTFLLIEGLSSVQGGRLHPHIYGECRTEKERERKYISEIERIINKEILGDKDNPTQWSVPTATKTGEATQIGIINFENYKVRNIINNSNALIEASVSDQNRKKQWQDSIKYYQQAMTICREKIGDYTQDELKKFDDCSQDFFQIWVRLHSERGVTNYIHMFGCGHIVQYMKEWGNLNRFSQQGWEALNALIIFFFVGRIRVVIKVEQTHLLMDASRNQN